MIVCVCRAVRDRDITRALASGAKCANEVARCTGAGTGCGVCVETVREMVARHRGGIVRDEAEQELAAK